MKKYFRYFLLFTLLFLVSIFAYTQKELAKTVAGIPVNYNEDSVGTYTLPNPLQLNNGTLVTTADAWIRKRRPEIVKLYEDNQFGKIRGRPAALRGPSCAAAR